VFGLVVENRVSCAVVSDLQAVDACLRFIDDHRILVEPACGASIATAYANAPELGTYKNITIIVCGGTTASLEQLKDWHLGLMAK